VEGHEEDTRMKTGTSMKTGHELKTGNENKERSKSYLPNHGTNFLRMRGLSIREPYDHSLGMFDGSADVVVYGGWF
jgi:hypothetical protein